MSTNYKPLKDLSYKKVKKLCPEIGFVKTSSASNKWGEVMQLGENYMHFYEYDNKITEFTRYGSNRVAEMLELIQDRLETDVCDEYSDEYEQMHLENLTEEERKEFLGEPS